MLNISKMILVCAIMVTATFGFKHRRDPLNDFGAAPTSEIGDSSFTEYNFT